jgi:hypothetical protein
MTVPKILAEALAGLEDDHEVFGGSTTSTKKLPRSDVEGDEREEPPWPESEADYGYSATAEWAGGAEWSGAYAPPLTIEEWLARELPEPDCLMGAVMTTTSRLLLVGEPGIGKTNFLMACGMRMSAGAGFLHWRPRRTCNVLYVDGEMSRRLLKQRIADEVERIGDRPASFYALSHEDVEDFAPLNTPSGQACIEREIKRIGHVDFLILDSIMCLTVGDMKEEISWQQTLPWIRSLTRRNIGQLWGHHTGHDASRTYGTKTREWQMDTVMHLEAIERPDTDISFRLEFRKARERTPSNRTDFAHVQIALVNNEWTWQTADGGSSVKEKVSPFASKFLEALYDATSTKMRGYPAATLEEWRAECVNRGLLEADRPDSARALLSKYKRELIVANRIACNEEMAWVLT